MSRLRTAVTASVAALALLVGGAAVISAVSLTQSAWADRTQVSAPVTGGTWNAPTSVGCVAMNANGTAKSGGYCTVKSVTVSNEWGNAGSRTRNYTANFDTNAAEGYIQFTIDLSKGGGAANFSWTNAGLVTGNNAQATPNNGWTCAQLPILTAKTPTNWGWGANSSIFFQITENRTTTASTCS